MENTEVDLFSGIIPGRAWYSVGCNEENKFCVMKRVFTFTYVLFMLVELGGNLILMAQRVV
jgi:hypothetical protein